LGDGESVDGLVVTEKLEEAMDRVIGMEEGVVEGRMGSYHEVHLLVGGILHHPLTKELIVRELIVSREVERIGIALEGGSITLKAESESGGSLVDEVEIAVACKAVLREVELLRANTIGIIIHLAHDGEKNGSMTFPKRGIALPKAFPSIEKEGDRLGTPMGDGKGEVVVGDLHKLFVLYLRMQRYMFFLD
jgi:hypothetical protein